MTHSKLRVLAIKKVTHNKRSFKKIYKFDYSKIANY